MDDPTIYDTLHISKHHFLSLPFRIPNFPCLSAAWEAVLAWLVEPAVGPHKSHPSRIHFLEFGRSSCHLQLTLFAVQLCKEIDSSLFVQLKYLHTVLSIAICHVFFSAGWWKICFTQFIVTEISCDNIKCRNSRAVMKYFQFNFKHVPVILCIVEEMLGKHVLIELKRFCLITGPFMLATQMWSVKL